MRKKNYQPSTLATMLGITKEGAAKGLPAGEIINSSLNGMLDVFAGLERPNNIIGGMDAPEM